MANPRNEYDPTRKPQYRGENRRRYLSKSTRALQNFRGYADPKETERYEREMTDVMRKMLKKLNLQHRFDEQVVIDAWEEIAGEFAAKHSRPVEVKFGVLVVQVLQSTMHYTLGRQKSVILKKLQERFGRKNIRDVRFQLG